jgi:SAM-dependent MidA family methyltransferase
MNQYLFNIITEKINQQSKKRITFADYMAEVLYHPQWGYYNSENREIGKKGDFFTASSLGCDFAELIGEQIKEIWENLGYPNPFYFLEMGAGTGIFAKDILTYIETKYPDFFEVLIYSIIEKSVSLIKKQKEMLHQWVNISSNKIIWKNWTDIKDDSLIGCAFSNELIDAFPVHRIIYTEGKLKEIYLTLSEDNNLIETIDEVSTEEIINYFKLNKVDFSDNGVTSNKYPDNYTTEVNLQAKSWLQNINNKLNKGYLITIDYGYSQEKYYHPQRYQGTLKCYYKHRHHDNPYLNLGQQDLTAHVNFSALELWGEELGLINLGLTSQGLFLMALGLGDRLNDLSSGKFNIQELLNRRDYLHQLIDPQGLGGFKVLIQGKNLTIQEEKKLLKGLNFN